jgi:hypothetical protein
MTSSAVRRLALRALAGLAGLLLLLGGLAPALQAPPKVHAAGGTRLFLPLVNPPAKVVPPLSVTPGRGLYSAPITVRLGPAAVGATIYYSLDGTVPVPGRAFVYTEPLPVDRTTVLRAVALRAGGTASPVATHTYLFLDDVLQQPREPTCQRVGDQPPCFPGFWGFYPSYYHPRYKPGEPIPADYAMDPRVVAQHQGTLPGDLLGLPSVSLVTDPADMFEASRGIYANSLSEGPEWERAASVEYLRPDGRDGFQIDAGVRIAGRWSRKPEGMAKHSFSLRFSSRYGPSKLRYKLFPDSPVDKFDTLRLRAGQADTFHYTPGKAQYLHDQWGRDTQRDMGWPAAHGSYVHLYIDGLYWGLYNLTEEPTADMAASYLGGEAEDWDVIKEGQEVEDGQLAAYQAMLAILAEGPPTPERFERLSAYLDLAEVADYHLLQIYSGNWDWPINNWRAARRRSGGPFHFFVWDMEHVAALDTEGVDSNIAGTGGVDGLQGWLAQSPEYRLLFADRVQRQLFGRGALAPAVAWQRYDARAREIERAMIGESARWGDVIPGQLTFVDNYSRWCTHLRETCGLSCAAGYAAACPQTQDGQWQPERERLREQFFPQRTAAVLGQLCGVGLYPAVVPPRLSDDARLHGSGRQLVIGRGEGEPSCPGADAGGIVWYTLDGSDPREAWTGRPSRSARVYRGPVPLAGYARVTARAVVAGAEGLAWSAAATALYGLPRLGISELMYHPPEGEDHEWLELVNRETFEVDLGGFVTRGVTATLPAGTRLGPGEHLVLAAATDSFAEDYPGVSVAAEFTGKLSDKGERLALETPSGEVVTELSYSDGGFWPRSPDGHGWSLVRAEAALAADDPAAWRASARPGGSPGVADPPPPYAPVVINELLPRAVPPFEAAIELYNPSAEPARVGGWGLGNSPDDPFRYRLPAGSTVPAGGYLVLYGADLASAPDGGPALPAIGGSLLLASADQAGHWTGLLAGVDYGAMPANMAAGRFRTSVRLTFDTLARPTFGIEEPTSVEEFRTGTGAPNAAPRTAAVRINEVMYHPVGNNPEFVELYNPGSAPMPLADPVFGGQRWQLAGAVSYTFPEGAVVPAGGFLVLGGVDPELVRRAYGIPADVPVVGPWQGKLDNAGERLDLLAPVQLAGEAFAKDRVETISYGTLPPWPSTADGGGPSLERTDPPGYADEPTSWTGLSRQGSAGRLNTRVRRLWLPLVVTAP